MWTFKQENSYTKHMAVHASSMMSGRIQSDHGCGTGDRYHNIFSDVDALYPGRRRHSMADASGEIKKTGKLFRPATMSSDTAELPAEAAGMTAAGRYGGLFSPSAPVADSTSYGKFGRHKSVAGSGSLVDALNDSSSPGSGGNRSDCGDGIASSPLAVNGGTGALMSGGGGGGGGSSLFSGSFGYDVDDVGIYRRSMSRTGIDDSAAFRPHVGYPFAQSYLNHTTHHQANPSSFVLRQPTDHQPSLLSHQQQQHQPQNSSIFYGQSSGLADADGVMTGGRESSPVNGQSRRYFSPATGYFGATAASGGVMSPTYGGSDSAATRYDGALGSLNSYFHRGGAFTSPGVASALHHLARSLPVFR